MSPLLLRRGHVFMMSGQVSVSFYFVTISLIFTSDTPIRNTFKGKSIQKSVFSSVHTHVLAFLGVHVLSFL